VIIYAAFFAYQQISAFMDFSFGLSRFFSWFVLFETISEHIALLEVPVGRLDRRRLVLGAGRGAARRF
jgi:hypothetical protein